MRETKFRAWDKKEKRMSKPFEIGDLTGYEGEGGSWVFYQERDGDDTFDFSNNNKSLLSNIELLQYTGLKDKNKIEGYFSDIVKFQFTTSKCYGNPTTIDLVGEIKENSHCHSCIMVKSKEYNIDNIFNGEIIGNIYENPELLKQ